MSDEKTKKSGWLGKLLFTEEYLQKNSTGEENTSQQSTTVINQTKTVVIPSADVNARIIDKLSEILGKLNMPGVDFYEVYKACQDMGGVTEANVKAAVAALRTIDSGLTKDKIISTSDYYCTELQKAIDTDVTKKNQQKSDLISQKSQKSASLQMDINSIEGQISLLETQLNEKKISLNNINSEFDPQITNIDQSITAGNNAVAFLVGKMREAAIIIGRAL